MSRSRKMATKVRVSNNGEKANDARTTVGRVWEKPGADATALIKEEFLFALGLKRTSDVLLRRELRLESVTTCLLLRNKRREISPAPPLEKSVRIMLGKISTCNKKVFLCSQCKFFSYLKTKVRYHGRKEHLELVSKIPTTKTVKVKRNARKNNRKRKPVTARATVGKSRMEMKLSCRTCGFVGHAQSEMEAHQLSLHQKTLQLKLFKLPESWL